jgi:hypothetical protein
MLRAVVVSVAMMLVAGNVKADDNTHLLQKSGDLKPNGQVIFSLPQLKRGELLSTYVEGTNKDGDLDCYILIKGPSDKAWHILALDESNKNSCSIRIYPQTDFPVKLWILNNGTKIDSFSVVVDQ